MKLNNMRIFAILASILMLTVIAIPKSVAYITLGRSASFLCPKYGAKFHRVVVEVKT